MRTPDELTRRFRDRGLKVTPQRQAVFRVLHGDHTHPTADAVHAAVVAEMPTVSLRTVYQTLNDLAEMGEILQLRLGTGSARFDANVEEPHHHLVCDGCGMVRDVPVAVAPGLDPDHLAGSLPADFRVSGADLVIRGTCPDCDRRARPVA